MNIQAVDPILMGTLLFREQLAFMFHGSMPDGQTYVGGPKYCAIPIRHQHIAGVREPVGTCLYEARISRAPT